MKLTHFLSLLLSLALGLAIAVGALLVLTRERWLPASTSPDDSTQSPAAATAESVLPSTAPASPTPYRQSARPVDRLLLSYSGQPAPGGKAKDVTSGQPHKLSLYQDEGFSSINRAKLDLDRDGRWDEKFTFANDRIERFVAPADDEIYSERWFWSPDENAWLLQGAASPGSGQAALPAVESTSSPGRGGTALPAGSNALPLREVDRAALTFQGKNIGADKIKDAAPGRRYKINVYQDAGLNSVNRLKIDLDRDEKWDEKFSFASGRATRVVAPADDENYTEKYRLTPDGWVKE